MLYSFLIIFIVCVVISAFLTKSVRDLAIGRGWVDKPDSGRHLHSRPVPRLGGVAIFAAVIITASAGLCLQAAAGLPSLVSVKTTLAILGPATLIFLMGLYDDRRGLPPRAKFGIEIVAAAWLYFEGIGVRRLDLFFGPSDLKVSLGIPLTILWVLLITNALNLIDGLDGLAAGSALFSTLTLLVVSLFSHNLFVAFLTVALAGAIIGFLRFNFHPATVFLGDSGSLFIGFLLSALALAGSQKAPTMVSVVVPVICFGFPILDVTLAVARRFLSGRPLFEGDHDHIHHRLLKRGFSQRGVVAILYAVSGLLALLSLASMRGGEVTALVLALIAVGVCVGIPQLKFHEFEELRRVMDRTMRQKQVIENDLHVRRATESLRTCEDVAGICQVLAGAMRPIGFDGFSLRLPSEACLPPSLPAPFRQSSNGELTCSWGKHGTLRGNWELRWELLDEQGKSSGWFSAYRRLTEEPLLMDVSLLSNGFSTALAGALRRTAMEVSLSAASQKQKFPRGRIGSAISLDDPAPRRVASHATEEPAGHVKSKRPTPNLSTVESKGEL